MAETSFGVTYDGPALADGRMPVSDLAPALLALGELFAEASVLVYPDREPVSLNIQATNEGSFDVALLLATGGAWDQVVGLFSSQTATALATLTTFVVGGTGLFAWIKTQRNRAIVKRERDPETGHIRVTFPDGTQVEVPAEVLALSENLSIRKKARAVIQPLLRSEIDRVDMRSDHEVEVSITDSDVEAFTVPEPEDVPLTDQKIEMAVSIASAVFTEGNKWRFSDGERLFYASIEDWAFLDRVDKAIEVFRKGDVLRCNMHVVQVQRDGNLHADYTVLDVLKHIPKMPQLTLDGDDDASIESPE
jgi:hypothetical protein